MENTPTVPNNELEQRYIRYKDVIKELTIMNDIFMRNVFKKRECIEHVLRIIMEMKNLQVLDYTVQKDYKNLQGRSAILDCVARDDVNNQYNVEIQQDTEGASPKWKPGDRVAINPQINDETCPMCRKGLPHLCDHSLLIGSSMRGFLDGAMCEYLIMHEKQLYHLPDEVSYDHGTFLDPLGNAIHLINRGGVKLGDVVVIIGAGTIGLLAIQTAKLAGAVKVIAVDLSDYKLEIAKDVGADICLKSDDPEFMDKIKAETHGAGPDVVVEAVGIGVTYNLALNMCKKRGTVVALGFTKPELNIAIQQIIYKELNVYGSTGYADECETTLEFLRMKKVDIDKVITHRLPLEKVKEGFDLLCDKNSGAIKVILNP